MKKRDETIKKQDRVYSYSAYKEEHVKPLNLTYYIWDLEKRGKVFWCKKSSKESSDKLFKNLSLDLIDSKIFQIES